MQGKIGFQKLQNFWVAKAQMSSYILCKILSFKPTSHEKYYIRLKFLGTVNCAAPFQCSELSFL